MAVRSLPGSYLVLEFTNHCNLACVHCAVYEDKTAEQGHPHYQKKGYLDPQLLRNLLDDLIQKKIRFDALILFWLGEPLLHPEFTRLYRMALRAAQEHDIFGKIEVHSNVVLLKEAQRRTLLNSASVPQILHCSLDAHSVETYQRIKGSSQFEQARDNARSLLLEKHQKGSRWPRIIMQYIVGSNNRHEISDFRSYWENTARTANIPFQISVGTVETGTTDGIFFRQLDCSDRETQLRENKVFREEMKKEELFFDVKEPVQEMNDENRHPCSGFWKSPVIDWTGEVTVCTRDNELKNCLGSIEQHSFSQIWWGERNRANRRAVAKACYDDLELCQDCFIPLSLNHSVISAEEINDFDETIEC